MAAMDVLLGCKVTNFNMPGRAEALRLALAIGGVDFEDERVAFGDWGTSKPSWPFQSLPALTLKNGEVLTQWRSILRWLGPKFNMYPADALLALRCDELMDAADDLIVKTNNCGQGLAIEEKLTKRIEAAAEGGSIANHLGCLEAFIAKHGSGGYAIGASLTVADLVLYNTVGMAASGFFDGLDSSILKRYPLICAVRKSVVEHPAVAAYYSKRPTEDDTIGKTESCIVKSARGEY
jgi:glutathione S-transferase